MNFDENDAVARYRALEMGESKNRQRADDQRLARALIVADAKSHLAADDFKAFLEKIQCADSTSRELLKIAAAGNANDVRRATRLRVADHRARRKAAAADAAVTCPDVTAAPSTEPVIGVQRSPVPAKVPPPKPVNDVVDGEFQAPVITAAEIEALIKPILDFKEKYAEAFTEADRFGSGFDFPDATLPLYDAVEDALEIIRELEREVQTAVDGPYWERKRRQEQAAKNHTAAIRAEWKAAHPGQPCRLGANRLWVWKRSEIASNMGASDVQ